MAQRQFKSLVMLALVLLAASCASARQGPMPYPMDSQMSGGIPLPSSPYSFMTSKPGYATLHGRLVVLNPEVLLPKPDGIHLVPFEGEIQENIVPPFVEGQVPQADVDETTGEFVFVNISPGRYVVVVVTLSGLRRMATEWEKEEFVVVTVKESDLNRTVELGMIRVP